jgi:hypothetical protein
MVPAAIFASTFQALVLLLETDDVVIDGGNSFYQDDIRRSEIVRIPISSPRLDLQIEAAWSSISEPRHTSLAGGRLLGCCFVQ